MNEHETYIQSTGGADSLTTTDIDLSSLTLSHDPDNLIRTQDLEVWLEENSKLYIFNRASFAQTQARIGGEPMFFESPLCEAVDIDDAASWRLAELIALGMSREAS